RPEMPSSLQAEGAREGGSRVSGAGGCAEYWGESINESPQRLTERPFRRILLQHAVQIQPQREADHVWESGHQAVGIKLDFFGAGAPGSQVQQATQAVVGLLLKGRDLVDQRRDHYLWKLPLLGHAGAHLGVVVAKVVALGGGALQV